MSATRGIIAGVLALSLAQATLANAESTSGPGAAATAFTLAAGVLRRLVDPTVALIPDRRKSSPATTPSVYTVNPPTTTTTTPASSTTLRPAPTGQTTIPA